MHAYAVELSKELGLKPEQVDRTLALNAEGATVPFIARYRKEATGGLDEVADPGHPGPSRRTARAR